MEKADNIQEQMGNVSREMKIKRIEKKCQKSKTVIEIMKNDFDGLISRLDTVEESICELGNVSIETSKTEKQREKQTKKKKKNRISKNCVTTTKV